MKFMGEKLVLLPDTILLCRNLTVCIVRSASLDTDFINCLDEFHVSLNADKLLSQVYIYNVKKYIEKLFRSSGVEA